MTEALLVVVDDACYTYPSDDLPDAWDEAYVDEQFRRLCGSLIEVRRHDEEEPAEKWTVHFVHFSVREYLSQATDVNPLALDTICLSDAAFEHDFLAQICLQYLCYDNLNKEYHSTKDSLEKITEQYQFVAYAARCWYLHASSSNLRSPGLVRQSKRLFEPATLRWILWSNMFETEKDSFKKFDERSRDKYLSSLYYASLLGLTETLKYLQGEGVELNEKGGKYGSALQAAAVNNHSPAVEFLLRHKANVNISGGEFGSAVAGAASQGHESVVKLLLDHGAEFKVAKEDGITALYTTTLNGHESVVKLLLDHGAEVKAASKDGVTTLHQAANNGHDLVVKLLLDHGAEVKAVDNDGQTALHNAIYGGWTDIIQILLLAGADPLLPDGYGRTCVDWVSELHLRLNNILSYGIGYQLTEEATKNRILRQSILKVANRLLLSKDNDLYHYLGHCLLLNCDYQEACTAFEQRITSASKESTPIHSAYCNMCTLKDSISGKRYICCSCVDVDVCASCMEDYNTGASIRTCKGHKFLKVPGDAWQSLPVSEVNGLGESEKQWVQRLAKQYDQLLVRSNAA